MSPTATPYRAILTGATGGIGGAIARRLAPSCEWLLITGRDAAALSALRKEPGMANVHMIAGDLADMATLDAIAAQARALGGANLLINNAGAGGFHAFQTQAPEAIRTMVTANLLAPMLLTQRLLPQLLEAPAAQVVNIGSLFGYIGYPGFAAYAGSKSGLRGFTQALRRELADTGGRAISYRAPPRLPSIARPSSHSIGTWVRQSIHPSAWQASSWTFSQPRDGSTSRASRKRCWC
jgi:short-subunit dehydrogenase